jgi:hypothetical protein
VKHTSNENQAIDSDLKALNIVYDELSKDARTITKDLSEAVAAYFILGFYMIAFGLGIDYYLFLTGGIDLSNISFLTIWIIFVNLIPIGAGACVLYRYSKLNARYSALFSLEKSLRLKEYNERKAKRD